MTSAKDHQKNRYNLEESIYDFLLYYNDRKDSTIKVVPFRTVIDIENKDLIDKIKMNTIKRRQKAKMLIEFFFEK